MGCDIHPYPEKLVDGEWVPAEPFVISNWWYERILEDEFDYNTPEYDKAEAAFDAMPHDEVWEKYGNDPRTYLEGPWRNYDLSGRNYPWFAILAGVRNGYGIEPMDEERGLPDDVSPEIKRKSDHEGCDAHSHSWFTFRELLDYNWDGSFLHNEGVVGKKGFMQYKTNGCPSWWSVPNRIGDTDRYISNYQMGQACMGIYGLLEPDQNYVTIVNWTQSHRELVGEDYLRVIFDKLASYGDPDEVRLVFWFDN